MSEAPFPTRYRKRLLAGQELRLLRLIWEEGDPGIPELARMMGLAESTVSATLSKLRLKLRQRTSLGMVRAAMAQGLVAPPVGCDHVEITHRCKVCGKEW